MKLRVIRAALSLVVAGGLGWFAVVPGAHAQTAVKLSLDGKIDGAAAPFLFALEGGYFKRAGLDVTIDPAANVTEPIARVANETHDFAVGDFNALIRFRDQNPTAAVKAVFMLQEQAGYAVVGRRSRGVVGPKSLEEAKIAVSPADPGAGQWPLFVKLLGLDLANATILNTGLPVREPMLAAGEADAAVGLNYTVPLNLREKGVPADDIVVMRMLDYGLVLYGSAILVRPKLLAERPEVVKAFVTAFHAALKDTIKDPARAIEALAQRVSNINREVELQRLTILLKENVVPAPHPAEPSPDRLPDRLQDLGTIDAGRFDKALEQMALIYAFKNKPKLADVFDERFQPPAADRAGN